MLQGEERWRRRRFRNERKIRHFVAAIGEVDGRRRLRRPRYAGEQDVRLLPILRADAIIMRDAELDGIDAGEICGVQRSEEHTSELQSLMRISYAVFCLKHKQT